MKIKTSAELETQLEDQRERLGQLEASFIVARSHFAESISKLDDEDPSTRDRVDAARVGLHAAEQAVSDQKALIADSEHRLEQARKRENDPERPKVAARAIELRELIRHDSVTKRLAPIRARQQKALEALAECIVERCALRTELVGLRQEYLKCQTYLGEEGRVDDRVNYCCDLTDVASALEELAKGCADPVQRQMVLDLRPRGAGLAW